MRNYALFVLGKKMTSMSSTNSSVEENPENVGFPGLEDNGRSSTFTRQDTRTGLRIREVWVSRQHVENLGMSRVFDCLYA